MNSGDHEGAPAESHLRQALTTARAALTEIAAISGWPIRHIALDALEKMEGSDGKA